MPPKLNTQQWIAKAKEKYGDKFTYEKAKYTGQEQPITVTCRIHGDLNFERSKSFLRHRTEPCRYCNGYLPKCDGTQKWFKEWLIYDEVLGRFFNKANREELGYMKKDGYRELSFDENKVKEHVLVFFWHHGFSPEIVDHIDRDKQNNRIDNLRAATKTLNMMNSTDYKPKFKNNKYEAAVKYKGKNIYIGQFETEEGAKQAMQDKRDEFALIEEKTAMKR